MRALALLCINQQSKFEVPSFTISKDMIETKKFKTGLYVTLTTPILGVVCHL